jgi:arylsulfatase A-like enzyme
MAVQSDYLAFAIFLADDISTAMEDATALPYNIILVIADTLRRDCLSLFDPTYAFTPRLGEQMRDWQTFPHCFSAAPWTLPSITTIMTGINASEHGHFFHDGRLSSLRILPQYLPADYRKIGIVNNSNLEPNRGFGAGYDNYFYCRSANLEEPFVRAREFLESTEAREKPYFLLLHSNLPHHYGYSAARPFYECCFPERRDWFQVTPRLISWDGLTPGQRRRIKSFYDACVWRFDEELSSVLQHVDLAKTIVCLVADHGEGFDYENGRLHHGGRVHNDLVNVPLVFHLPLAAQTSDRDAMRRSASSAVSTADIVPTILELAGIAIPDALSGQSLLAHRDKSTVIISEDQRFLYIRNRFRLNVNKAGKNMTALMKIKNNILQATAGRAHNLRAFIQFPYKLIVTSFTPRAASNVFLSLITRKLFPENAIVRRHRSSWLGLELFDLSKDPNEFHNLLYGQSPAEVAGFIASRLPQVCDASVLLGGRLERFGDIVSLFR